MIRSARYRERDLLLLEGLSLRVRLISQRQIADAFWNGHLANTRRRMRQLQRDGLVERQVVHLLPLPEISVPIVCWQPGQPIPNSDSIAFQLQSRWRYRSLRPTVVYFPTKSAIDYFGGRERSQSRITQFTHDLGVTAVWLRYVSQSSLHASIWVGEEILAPTRQGQKLPDAAIVDQHGEPTLFIEFGGSYGATRVSAFHDDAAARGLPYQLWQRYHHDES